MHPQPQTISSQLIKELDALPPEERHNSFVLRGYRKKAKALCRVDPFSGYLVLGMIATLERNVDEMHNHYRRAFKLNPANPVGYHNYAVSLGKLGIYSEYITYAHKAYETNRGDLNSLEFLIDTSLIVGQIYQANQLLDEWNRLCPKRSNPSSAGIENAIKIMENHGITQDDVEKIQQIAVSLLQKRNIYIHLTHFQVKRHEGEGWIQYVYELDDVTPAQLIELEDELDRELQQFSPQITEAVTIEYTIEEPELDGFLEYMEKHFEEHPENIVEVDQEQLNRIAELIGEKK